jgi:gliding motility-associated-like protein
LKRLSAILLLLFLCQLVYANHTKGGYIYYEYVGPGSAANTLRYRIVLKLYTECQLNTGQFDQSVNFSFFDAGSGQLVSTDAVPFRDSVNIQNCTLPACYPCIVPIPSICYKISTYEMVKDLPRRPAGYVVAYQRCCRIAGINNIQAPSNAIGETWTVNIPGSAAPFSAELNSSPRFLQNDTAIICEGAAFTFDFSAVDPNGDSLTYEFCDAYLGGSTGNPVPATASQPPYGTVPYSGSFSSSQPMGNGVAINRFTGQVSGTGPASGIYILTACVTEYQRGTNIVRARSRKSLHILVADCQLTQARLNPEYITCDGFTLSFSNNASSNNIQTWFWDFGVPGTNTDTSILATPTFTYPDTGTYTITLIVNKGLACSDIARARVKVYPGFFPNFTVAGQCKNRPIVFSDATVATYGVPNSWSWNFGDPSTTLDVSTQQNPSYIYTSSGNYTVSLLVTSSKGCSDTITKEIAVLDKPTFGLTNDTLICDIDTLQLQAVGIGTFDWSPNYNISSLTGPSPLVSPDIPFTYNVTFTDAFGCVGSDSVRINVKSFVTLEAGNDTTICRTDAITLRPFSDGLNYEWRPAATLSNPAIKNPIARPLSDIKYYVTSRIGKCFADDSLSVRVVPYPTIQASNDTAICFGDNAQLSASGGVFYTWLPASYLTNNLIARPVSVSPPASVRYVVFVRDTIGCPKPSIDTVFVRVYPKILADAGPRDTSVVEGEPLVLNGSGGVSYVWSPPLYLNNTNSKNPVSQPRNNIEYVVRASNEAGCFGTDTILVKVFFVAPGFYVPNAFSPNGDGRNDVFRPILLGMKSLDRFAVYNRWGQMVFSTTTIGQGWDGNFGGRGQDAATYVWLVDGVDFRNNRVKKQGTVVLIR